MLTGFAKGSWIGGSDIYVMGITLYFVTRITLFYWGISVVHYTRNFIYKEGNLEEFIFTICVSINAFIPIRR